MTGKAWAGHRSDAIIGNKRFDQDGYAMNAACTHTAVA